MDIKNKYDAVIGREGLEHLKDIVLSRSNVTPGKIDANQRHINRLLGIGDEVFLKYSQDCQPGALAAKAQTRAALNAFRNAGDLVFSKYRNNPEKWPEIIDECQRNINELMGISDESFVDYMCKKEAQENSTIDETQRKINQIIGVDDETFKKYNK